MNKQANFAQLDSRAYLTNEILSVLQSLNKSFREIAKEVKISRGTLLNMKKGRWPDLPTLCYLFSHPIISPHLSGEIAFKAASLIIAESLRTAGRCPVFQLVEVKDSEHISSEYSSLPQFMQGCRNRLNFPIREVERRCESCSWIQISRIEKDCKGVKMGVVCHLFDNYFRDFSTPSTESWSIFATLMFRFLFPNMKGYVMEFVEWS